MMVFAIRLLWCCCSKGCLWSKGRGVVIESQNPTHSPWAGIFLYRYNFQTGIASIHFIESCTCTKFTAQISDTKLKEFVSSMIEHSEWVGL